MRKGEVRGGQVREEGERGERPEGEVRVGNGERGR